MTQMYHRLRTHVPPGLIPRLHGMEPGQKANLRLIYKYTSWDGTVCMYFYIVSCSTFIHAVTYKLQVKSTSDVVYSSSLCINKDSIFFL